MLAGSHQCEGCIVCWKTSARDCRTVASMTPWHWEVGADVRTDVCCGCSRNELHSGDSGSPLWDPGITCIYSLYLFIYSFIHSLFTVSYDRSIASSKTFSGECFLFQFPIPTPSLPYGHPVAVYVSFPVFSSLLPCIVSLVTCFRSDSYARCNQSS